MNKNCQNYNAKNKIIANNYKYILFTFDGGGIDGDGKGTQGDGGSRWDDG